MMNSSTRISILSASTVLVILLSNPFAKAAEPAPAGTNAAAKATKKAEKPFAPGGVYRVGDMSRPRPPAVDPGTASSPAQPGRPPSDAIVLFDGKDLSQWETRDKGKTNPPGWKVENGYMEIVPKTGAIHSKQRFGDSQVHIEWATPSEVKGNSQGRGNSGVYLPGFGELQVLDSYQNDTYPDGQASALYGKYPPQVNASRKPGEWQAYDIVLELTRFDTKGQLSRPGRITVFHNGVCVHHAVEFANRMGEGSLGFQDHGNPVRYRNVWFRKLPGYDSATNAPAVIK